MLKLDVMESNSNQFSAQDSLDLIERVIEQTRERYEENGVNITLWGLAVIIAGVSAFILTQTGHGDQSGLPWLLTILPLFVYTFIRGAKKGRSNKMKNAFHLADSAWLMAGIFALITGFILRPQLGLGFLPALYLPFCIAALVTALHLKNRVFVGLTIASSALAYTAVFIPVDYHSLLSAGLALLMFFIPGLMLRADYNRRQ